MDIERIKSEIPIESLVARSGLTVISDGSHRLTTEEHDSLKLFTNNNSWTWYSQAGRNGKAQGGSVIDWYMLSHQCSQRDAIKALTAMLEGGVVEELPAPRTVGSQKPEAEWRNPEWQKRAWSLLRNAQDTLWNKDAGAAGRAYLEGRGLRLDTAVQYGLGVATVFNPRAKERMPAIIVPWLNRQICAIQYRFLDIAKDETRAARFGQMKGGERILFGLPTCFSLPGYKPHTLFAVEGEMNAMAIAQAVRDMGLPVDAVSFGTEANIANDATLDVLRKMMPGYRHVIVWADKATKAQTALKSLPGITMAVKSPGGQDANDLLRDGNLHEWIWELMQLAEEEVHI